MKYLFLLIPLLFIFTGCSGHTPAPDTRESDISKANLPSWVIDPKVPEKIAAIGSCPPHPKGAYMQRTTALANARQSLSMILNSAITVTRETMLREQNSQVQNLSSEEINAISDSLLLQSKQEDGFTAQDGTLYVLVSLEKSAITNALIGHRDTTSKVPDSISMKGNLFDLDPLLKSGCYDEKILRSIITKSPMKDAKPLWFYNPSLTGKMGAIGIAKKQPNTPFQKQKQLAMMLAQADYGKQLKTLNHTDISQKTTMKDTGTQEDYASDTNQKSAQNVTGLFIKDMWMDTKTCDLYLLVY